MPGMEERRTEPAGGDDADPPADVARSDRGGSGYVTTKIAAEALGVNPRTVRAYIDRGILEAKSEGEGIQKAYLVSIDSVYSLRDRRVVSADRPRSPDAGVRAKRETRGSSADASPSPPAEPANTSAAELADIVRELAADLARSSATAAEFRTRLELTSQAESTLRESLERERERADRLEAELASLRETRQLPPQTSGTSETSSEGANKGDASSEPQEHAQRRSWLYRFFFGP